MPDNKLPIDETSNPKGWVPMKLQRGFFSFLIAFGISLYTNPVMWNYLERIGFKYGFFIKVGLFGIIDVTLFWLTLWAITGRTVIHRLYCTAAALGLSFAMLFHTGMVGEGEAEYKDTVSYADATAKGLGEIAGAGAEGAAKGTGQAAMEANARGQRRLATRLGSQAGQSGNAATTEAQKTFLATMEAKQAEQANSWQGWYLRKAMMWFLMSLALVLATIAIFLAEDTDNDGFPDILQNWFRRVNRHQPQVSQPPAQPVAQTTTPRTAYTQRPTVPTVTHNTANSPAYTQTHNGHNGHNGHTRTTGHSVQPGTRGNLPGRT